MPLETRVPNVQTGFTLLPPAPGVCQECAVAHPPEAPHDRDSLYFQSAFWAKHRRWPTWRDAMAHCAPEVQQRWVEELTLCGVKVAAEVAFDAAVRRDG